MATLTLNQKAELQSNLRFQKRFHTAMAKIARYHIDFLPAAIADFNVERQKLKEYSRTIMEMGGVVSQTHIADYLSTFTEDTVSRLEDNQAFFDAETNQLSDTELYDGGTAVLVFSRQAGVLPGDATRQIIL